MIFALADCGTAGATRLASLSHTTSLAKNVPY